MPGGLRLERKIMFTQSVLTRNFLQGHLFYKPHDWLMFKSHDYSIYLTSMAWMCTENIRNMPMKTI